jgi:CheY-like chemotaxis protein
LSKLRIIVADDNPTSLQKFVSLLMTECDVVATAADAPTLLDLVNLYKPDLVVLHIRAQKLNGLEIAQALATYPKPPSVLLCAAEMGPEIVGERQPGTVPYLFNTRIDADLARDETTSSEQSVHVEDDLPLARLKGRLLN